MGRLLLHHKAAATVTVPAASIAIIPGAEGHRALTLEQWHAASTNAGLKDTWAWLEQPTGVQRGEGEGGRRVKAQKG